MKISSLSLALAFLTGVNADSLWRKWQQFKIDFDTEFQSMEEDHRRFDIYKQNLERASSLQKRSNGKTKFGVTQFAHLAAHEFKETMLGYKKTSSRDALKKEAIQKQYPNVEWNSQTAKSIDWRDVPNAVSPVKNQGQCGSCWAFSAVQAVETGYFKNTGNQKILSPQQVTTCDSHRGDYGCQGGNTFTAYDYMRAAGGLEQEKDYPYYSGTFGWRGWCRAKKSKFAVKVGNTTTISDSAEKEPNMLQEIQSSPMSICVDAEPWQMYTGGVIDHSTCGTTLDHCVHLVGYKGKSSNTNEDSNYWIVKNSWGASWGESGYIYVRQGENACGVAMETTIVDAMDEPKEELEL